MSHAWMSAILSLFLLTPYFTEFKSLYIKLNNETTSHYRYKELT